MAETSQSTSQDIPNPATSPGQIAPKPEEGVIRIQTSTLVGVVVSFAVLMIGWGVWGWVKDSVESNPKVNEIISNQKQLQKEMKSVEQAVVRIETKMGLKFDEYDRFLSRVEAELRRSGSGGGGGD